MIGIKINNVFLDLPRNASLRFNLRSFSYITSGSSDIQGGFSYTISIPRSDKNLKALNLPHRIDAADPLMQDEPVEFHFDGIPLFKGQAFVKQGGGKIKLYIILNELGSLKNTKLNQLDLGGDRAFGGPAEALTTAQNHLNYDFTFFSIDNDAFFEGNNIDPGTAYSKIQNAFQGGAFVNATDQLNAMPFVRLEYLIEQVFAELGYSLNNLFMTDDEWRSLYLYNNYSIYTVAGAWDTTINLANHVPMIEVGKFLKMLVSQFNLGIILNPFKRSTDLVKMDDIVMSDPAHDWTSKVVGQPYFKTNNSIPTKFMYAVDDSDEMMTGSEKYEDDFGVIYHPPFVESEFLPPWPTPSLEYHWIDSLTALYSFAPSSSPHKRAQALRPRTMSDALPPFKGEMIPLLQDPHYTAQFAKPKVLIPGTTSASNINDFNTRLTFYRGIVGGVPFANSGRYTQAISHTSPYQRSLYWYDDYGIYKNYWSSTVEAFKKRKDLSVSLKLSLADLINFDFRNKIRIDNMNYIVSRLQPTFKQTGLGLTSADLITCI